MTIKRKATLFDVAVAVVICLFICYCYRAGARPLKTAKLNHMVGNDTAENFPKKKKPTYLCVIEPDRSIANFTTDIGEHPSRSITWLLLCIQIVVTIAIEIVASVSHSNEIARQPGEQNSNCTNRMYRTGDDVMAMRSQMPPNTHYDCPAKN